MKYVAGLAIAMACSTTAFAQTTSGIGYKNVATGEGLRVGTFCRLTMDDDVGYEGLCNVYRKGSTTVVDAGRDKYTIVRDDFSFGRAMFYLNRQKVGWVTASGSCWEGSGVRYCAR